MATVPSSVPETAAPARPSRAAISAASAPFRVTPPKIRLPGSVSQSRSPTSISPPTRMGPRVTATFRATAFSALTAASH